MTAPFTVTHLPLEPMAQRRLDDAVARTSQRLAAALAGVAKLRANGLPHFRLPGATDDLPGIDAFAAEFVQGAQDVVVLGIGGSSLGAQALAQVMGWGTLADAPPAGRPNVYFPENLDGLALEGLLARLDLRTARFLAISKSGGTIETLAQLCTVIERIERALGPGAAASRIAVVTEPSPNPLRKIAERLGCRAMEHDPALGGRYSVLSLVGLIPARIAGLDPIAIRQGAADVLARLEDPSAPHAAGAAWNVAAADIGLNAHVMWAYAGRFDKFVMWWRQLWGESLGKSGKGTTPIHALGPVDQHSQLQLYLDGPDDKVFTFLTAGDAAGPQVPADWAAAAGLDQLGGKTFGRIVGAQARATAHTLAARGRPVRMIDAPRVDARTMGALFMHFMLETLIAAELLGVDPFDQPAVEEGKRLTRAFLAEGGA
jgi:glucose-6-phosphate isomerase